MLGSLSLKIDNIRILTLLVFTALCISSTSLVIDHIPSPTEKIPTENFVSIDITKSISPIFCDTGIDCEESVVIEASQGSGLAFQTIGEDTYIMSASHLCENAIYDTKQVESLKDSMINVDIKILVKDFYGNPWEAEIIDYEPSTDLCLLKSEMPRVKRVKLADSLPDPGERVYAISAPLSIRANGAVPHFEGIFSGCDPWDTCFYTIPATFGSSGSLILNSEYEIVGMIQAADPRFPTMSIGVSIVSIRDFLDNSASKGKLKISN